MKNIVYNIKNIIFLLDWIAFYSKPWVCAFLNHNYSFIALDIWQNAPDNTNVAESCHANCNRDGKALPLQVAILK